MKRDTLSSSRVSLIFLSMLIGTESILEFLFHPKGLKVDIDKIIVLRETSRERKALEHGFSECY